MKIQCRREVVKVFCRCVCFTASAQDYVQSKRPFATCTMTPRHHGYNILYLCFSTRPMQFCDCCISLLFPLRGNPISE
ncbi:hypothetical protein P692DRAFT_20523007, partial [Suillus brevipes Sb2]